MDSPALEKAREWELSFVRWYNDDHRHSALKFVTPGERHAGVDVQVLKRRDELYRAAKAARPERWSGATRNWQRQDTVVLNPDDSRSTATKRLQEAA